MASSPSSTKPVVTDPLAQTSKVAISLHGRDYYVTCDADEEARLAELVRFVDERLSFLSSRNSNMTETRLFMMACLMLADELIEAKQKASDGLLEEEDLMVAAVDHLRSRVASLARMVDQA